MVATFAEISATSARGSLTQTSDNLVNVDKLKLFNVGDTEKSFRPEAIRKAMPLIKMELEKNKALHGGLVSYFDGSSTSYARVVCVEKVAIDAHHPQYIEIEGETEYCMMRSHKVC